MVSPLNSGAVQGLVFLFVDSCFRGWWFGSINDVFAAWYVAVGHVLRVATIAVRTLDSIVHCSGHSLGHLNGNLVRPRVSRLLSNLHRLGHFNSLLNGIGLFSPARLIGGRL